MLSLRILALLVFGEPGEVVSTDLTLHETSDGRLIDTREVRITVPDQALLVYRNLRGQKKHN